jgi:hypothetical protein
MWNAPQGIWVHGRLTRVNPILYTGLWVQNNYREMMARYSQRLTYIKSAVTRNHSEKSINSILDYISTSKNVSSAS